MKSHLLIQIFGWEKNMKRERENTNVANDDKDVFYIISKWLWFMMSLIWKGQYINMYFDFEYDVFANNEFLFIIYYILYVNTDTCTVKWTYKPLCRLNMRKRKETKKTSNSSSDSVVAWNLAKTLFTNIFSLIWNAKRVFFFWIERKKNKQICCLIHTAINDKYKVCV